MEDTQTARLTLSGAAVFGLAALVLLFVLGAAVYVIPAGDRGFIVLEWLNGLVHDLVDYVRGR